MSKTATSLGDLIIGGGIGYIFGAKANVDNQKFFKDRETRFQHISHMKIPAPINFLQDENFKVIARETFHTSICGYPNAAVPLAVRQLEIGLKKIYEMKENKKSNLKLNDLIEWSEKYLGDKKHLAHWFRSLRNRIHDSQLVTEQDSYEAIRHVSIILNELWPADVAIVTVRCGFCPAEYKLQIYSYQCNIGEIISTLCSDCQKVNNMPLML